MDYVNRRIGDRVCEIVEARVRSWGFHVRDHSSDPREAPGDFLVWDGTPARLFVECKGYRTRVVGGPTPAGRPRITPPSGRPMLGWPQHARLVEADGVYVFARYSLEDGGEPRVRDVRWSRASAIPAHPAARVTAVPPRRIAALERLDAAGMRRLLGGPR